MTPYVLKYILNNTNDIMYEKTPITKRRVISEDTSAIMRYALESVSSRGTGRNAFKEGYRIGGSRKDGRALKPIFEGYRVPNKTRTAQ